MKARYSYAMLFFVPSAMIASLVAIVVVAAGAGVLWIFVYGDNQWPASANTGLMALAAATWGITLLALLALSYAVGKRREARGGLSRFHLLLALGLSVALPLLALLHQWQVGNLGGGDGAVQPYTVSEPTPLRGVP